jgi:hypothetical protein
MTDAPMPVTLAAGLRAEMCDFVRSAGARRVMPTVFHVGSPGRRPTVNHFAIADDRRFDHGLRADLVERAVGALSCERPVGWVTRTGTLAPTDPDFDWFAATREAFARHDLTLPGFFVITRTGWLNLMTENVVPQPGVRPRRSRPA